MSAVASVLGIAFGMLLGVCGLCVMVFRPEYRRLHGLALDVLSRFGDVRVYGCADCDNEVVQLVSKGRL